MAHEVSGEDIDVILVCAYIRILLGHLAETLIPERHGVDDAVRFCGRGQMLLSLPGQIEGVPEDSVHPAACENCLLNGQLVVRSLIETPAYIRIFALVVFANDTEINLPGLPMFKLCFNA